MEIYCFVQCYLREESSHYWFQWFESCSLNEQFRCNIPFFGWFSAVEIFFSRSLSLGPSKSGWLEMGGSRADSKKNAMFLITWSVVQINLKTTAKLCFYFTLKVSNGFVIKLRNAVETFKVEARVINCKISGCYFMFRLLKSIVILIYIFDQINVVFRLTSVFYKLQKSALAFLCQHTFTLHSFKQICKTFWLLF